MTIEVAHDDLSRTRVVSDPEVALEPGQARLMIERFGQGRFLTESGAKLVHQDATGKLWHKDLQDDEPMVMVEVLNSTPEPDGHTKTYFLRVHPELRPLLATGLGSPQEPTAHNAVASTFGLYGHEYHPLIET